jgi:hypothetical protein
MLIVVALLQFYHHRLMEKIRNKKMSVRLDAMTL